jgi:hypothetical protein
MGYDVIEPVHSNKREKMSIDDESAANGMLFQTEVGSFFNVASYRDNGRVVQ